MAPAKRLLALRALLEDQIYVNSQTSSTFVALVSQDTHFETHIILEKAHLRKGAPHYRVSNQNLCETDGLKDMTCKYDHRWRPRIYCEANKRLSYAVVPLQSSIRVRSTVEIWHISKRVPTKYVTIVGTDKYLQDL